MTNDDVLYAYRLRVLASAREFGSVAAACRAHGIHRSTYYRWKNAVERFGSEILRPRGRRAVLDLGGAGRLAGRPRRLRRRYLLKQERRVSTARGR
jgi:transposase-like protein